MPESLVLEDAWPLFGLTITTPRLTLRLPREDELAALAQVVADGIHPPDERPFLTPWTEVEPAVRARSVVQGHWEELGSWTVEAWCLGLAVFRVEEPHVPIGRVSLRARDFPVVREVATSSWLGLPHHGRGLGTEARGAVLALAFDHLGAEAARSEVFQDNHASQAVSRKLGYVRDGISRDARGDEVLVSDRLRLTRDVWTSRRPVEPVERVEVVGLEASRASFGLTEE